MAWRLAQSLVVLRDEVNAAAPNRSKASDGTIGDASHAASASDHNPNSAGVVCAFDITADPHSDAWAEQIRVGNHPAFKYVIWNRRIASKARASEGWRAYGGSDPHTSHIHVSVGVGSDGHSTGPYDDASPWGIEGDDMPTLDEIASVVQREIKKALDLQGVSGAADPRNDVVKAIQAHGDANWKK